MVTKPGKQLEETASESATNLPEKIPQENGRGALYAGGVPGNKGGGRTPDAFKAEMRKLVSHSARLKHLKSVLSNPDHPQFLAAYKFATEQGYGKPKETVEHSGTIQHGVVVLPPLEHDGNG